MENASAAFLAAVQRSMREIRKAVGTDVVDPQVLSCAERRQHSGWLRREEENTAILALAKQGVSIKEIVRRTNKSRGLVRQVVRGGRTDVFRSRQCSLDPFLKHLDVDWANGCRNGAALWRRVKAIGFSGSLRVVAEWAKLPKVPPAKPVERQRRGHADGKRKRPHRAELGRARFRRRAASPA